LSQRPQENDYDLVSLKEMKKDVGKILPPNSILRRLILSESDRLPREQAISTFPQAIFSKAFSQWYL